jgi:hypothetical protein
MGKPSKDALAWSPGSRFAPSARYEPRAATSTVLHEVVRDHVEQFLYESNRGNEDGPGVPKFVEQEFRRMLECGDLAGGFARLKCGACGKERLVPFSCKCRGACPSCAGRRMAERAEGLNPRGDEPRGQDSSCALTGSGGEALRAGSHQFDSPLGLRRLAAS